MNKKESPITGEVLKIKPQEKNRTSLFVQDVEGSKRWFNAWIDLPNELQEGSKIILYPKVVEKGDKTFYNVREIKLLNDDWTPKSKSEEEEGGEEQDKLEKPASPASPPTDFDNIRIKAATIASNAVFLHDIDKDTAVAFIGLCRRIERYIKNQEE